MSQKTKPGQDKAEQAKAAQDAIASAATKPEAQDAAPATQAPAPAVSNLKPQGDAGGEVKAPAKEPSALFERAVAFSAPGADAERIGGMRDIWESLRCDEVPAKLAVAVFDCGVHQGVKVAERLMGKVSAPYVGYDNDVTDEMINTVVTDFLAWRLRRYAFTASAASKMHGWALHVMRLQAFIMTELQSSDAT